MAISLVGANVEVAGYKDNGTATSGTALTLTDTSKSWTVDTYAERIAWIISGTGAGATGYILSNTATALTVRDGFFKVNTSGAVVSAVTPDNTSVYAIAWNGVDAVAAVPANCSWDNTSTLRTLRINKQLLVKANAAFGLVGRNIEITLADTFFSSEYPSLFQMGRINSDLRGVDGGYISMEKVSASYVSPAIRGFFKLYDGKITVNKGPSTGGNELRWSLGAATQNGVHFIDGEHTDVQILMQGGDVGVGFKLIKNRLGNYLTPPRVEGVTYIESMLSIGAMVGEDVFDFKTVGTISDPTYSRPLIYNTSALPGHVTYFWRPYIGAYSLTDCIDWYHAVATRNGIAYFGTTLAISSKDTGGSAVASVYIGVVKTSDGVGQIVTAKQGSGANYAPTKARFVVTDGSGEYAGPFGSGEGVFIATHKLTYNGPGGTTQFSSEYGCAVVDYTGYTLVLTKYGYIQQVNSRAFAYNAANAETAYLSVDPYVSASYAAAIAYTGMSVTPSTDIGVTTANTLQKLYDFIKARLQYEASTNDVHVVDPLISTDGTNYTLGSGWSLTENGNLDYGTARIAGGTIVFDAASTYAPTLGTCTIDFTAASGTYDLRTGDFTGTITLTNSGGGSITVQMPVGVTCVNTGPNITLEQTASVNIAISGFSTTSRLQIYDVDNTTELYNDVPGATSKTIAYTYTIDVNIRVRIADDGSGGANAKEFIETTQLMGSGGLSYGATQVADTTYNSNAIDGSGVVGMTIVPSPTRFEISIAGGSTTWPSIYAYQVYWLQTAVGIADEAAFIEGVDTANYILTDFQIKNTHANALTITGGWGRDATTLTVAGCIDTAGSTGNIFVEPDHVVAFATGSALSAGEAASLAAIEAVTAQMVFTVANQLDANALSGGGGLDAAGVRAAIGMAAADLDTQIAALPTAAEIIAADKGLTLNEFLALK